LHGGLQCGAIGLVESAEGFTHEALVEGGEDGLDGGELQEFSRQPVLHDDFAERRAEKEKGRAERSGTPRHANASTAAGC